MQSTSNTAAPRAFLSTADRARLIRRQLKRELGATSRHVSVRSDVYSLGSTIRVRIRDAAINLDEVRRIASTHEHVSRCEATGEILSGGNRSVDVEYTTEALAPLVEQITERLRSVEATPGRSVEIAGLACWASADERGMWHAVQPSAVEGLPYRVVYCHGIEFCARQIAVALATGQTPSRDVAPLAKAEPNAQLKFLAAIGCEVSA